VHVCVFVCVCVCVVCVHLVDFVFSCSSQPHSVNRDGDGDVVRDVVRDNDGDGDKTVIQ
jgi:hypothetical protein